jgi:signal recognition particle receptor subunit beta
VKDIQKSELVTLDSPVDKNTHIDFLQLNMGESKEYKVKIQIYSCPGHTNCNNTRHHILEDVDGIVMVFDSVKDRIEENLLSFKNLHENLIKYRYKPSNIPIVFQYNKRDLENAMPIDRLDEILNKKRVQNIEAIAINGVGVFNSLKLITSSCLEKMSEFFDSKIG